MLIFILSCFLVNGRAASKQKIKGSGQVQTSVQSTGRFESVDIKIDGKIDIIEGDDFTVMVSGYNNHLEYIRAEVNGGVLSLYYDMDAALVKTKNSATVVIPSRLRKIVTARNCAVTVRAPVSEELEIESAGSGSIDILNIANRKVTVISTGVGKIYIKGESDQLYIRSSGRSIIDCEYLDVRSAEIQQSGAGSSIVSPYSSLRINITGDGKIYYTGNPDIFGNNGSGSDKVIQKQ